MCVRACDLFDVCVSTCYEECRAAALPTVMPRWERRHNDSVAATAESALVVPSGGAPGVLSVSNLKYVPPHCGLWSQRVEVGLVDVGTGERPVHVFVTAGICSWTATS